MNLTFENLGGFRKIFFLEAESEPEAFGQVGMRLLLVELISEVAEHFRIVGVFHHAERECSENRLVVQIMLNRPTLESFDREFSFAQLGKITTLHEALHSGLNNFLDHRLDNCFTVHTKLLGRSDSFESRVSSCQFTVALTSRVTHTPLQLSFPR